MPKAKEGKRKTKGALLPIPILQKFLKTYEKYCAQSQTSVCPAIKKDLKKSIDSERILKKFTLVKPSSPRIVPPISLEPLLMTIRDECYKLGKEMCIWGFQLSNPEVARLALFLESKGHTTCPFTTLEIVDCKMDLWSLERLGKALQLSSLRSLVLDYCKFGNEEIESILSGLENNQSLYGLSLRFCGLGPWSGSKLGSIISQSAICELHLDGNSLLCSGALALLRPIAEYAEMKEKDGMAPPVSPDTATPSQLLQMSQRGSSLLGQTAKSSEAGTAKTTLGKKKNKKGIKKKAKALAEAGPWLVKLHLADNGIDGKEGEHLVEFTRILTCLIRFSAHLREVDLGSNALGEMAAADILQALRARKTGKLPILKITVTPQISSDTFTSIWKNSKKSKTKTIQKKKKMAKTRI
ncbi:NACHT, LRR and PYD domains-containing protein 5-like isoform X1 [Dipodomys merriami]|uniref:NACHT, LRR and PYD domains-containing protein 5-like isoform X1 n=1 Tax=Dipodomys merriami TaxID=94247 RepID=UPI003855F295